MKRILLFIISLSLSYLLETNYVNATVHIITAVSTPTEGFFPAITNAVCGDTIKWVLGNGTHTTASTSIPNGAAPWNSPNITTSGFIYVVTVPGTYNYTCHPTTGGHMDASIVVTCSTGVPSIDHDFASSVYPNPCSEKIVIETPMAEIISFYNVVGEKIKSVTVKTGQTKIEIDVAELTKGIYFVKIFNGEKIHTEKIMKL